MTIKQPTIELAHSVLNVKDLDQMSEFYEKVIGLSQIQSNDKRILLGIDTDEIPLLELRQTDHVFLGPTAGLYHNAFLLPERKDLANFIVHVANLKIPLTGGSDHGYSEAVYLDDPEGNGIEIYVDKPVEQWDISDDGQIAGVTIRMNLEEVLALADLDGAFQMPSGSSLGHIHLHVSDLDDSETFYVDDLGLELKYKFGPHARFLADGLYHHHIAMNVWDGQTLPARQPDQLGIEAFSILQRDPEKFEAVYNKLKSKHVLIEESEVQLTLKDPNGITIYYRKI